MPKIIDVIQHKNLHSTQTFIVLDEKPNIEYERDDDWLIGEDSGIFNFYFHEKPGRSFHAFAGRKFDIPLVGGGVEKADGQWWDYVPEDYSELVVQIGYGTPETLAKCNVFMSLYVDEYLVDSWLENNQPSNNYNKYDTNSKDYGLQTIVSKFD